MKNIFTIVLFLTSGVLSAQYEYAATPENPYGKPNPNAPKEVMDYADLIGLSECNSVSRKQDGTWADTVSMQWKWKYIMNGMGVQDETLKSDQSHSGSIRQYNKDSARWYVHYFSTSSPVAPLGYWEGNFKNNEMVLYREQAAPNGMEGFYRLTFYDISSGSFKWKGEWVKKDESIVYPTWKIDCKKIE